MDLGDPLKNTVARMNLTQLPFYATVDFEALAKKHAAFSVVWEQSSGHLDFHDPDTAQTLSKAILETDFGLDVEVPDDRLCPPIPNRWNYVAWIQRLLDSTSPTHSNKYDANRKVSGLDIGTGASAIYTMLCLQSRPNWTMCATDVDKKSFDAAIRNLTLNNLVTRTRMIQTIDSNPLIPLQYLGTDKLDFTMCNPPFFLDEDDMCLSIKGEGKSLKPNAVCTGSLSEMACPGGDVGFVTRIVEESLTLRDKVTWYSSLLGKLSSAKTIVDLLKKNGISNWAVGCIDTGGATKRWIVAWSFGEYRPRNVCIAPATSPLLYVLNRLIRISHALKKSQTNTFPFPLNIASLSPRILTLQWSRTPSIQIYRLSTYAGPGIVTHQQVSVRHPRTFGKELTGGSTTGRITGPPLLQAEKILKSRMRQLIRRFGWPSGYRSIKVQERY